MKSGDLQFNDTAHLKFSHNSEGVIAKYKNKKFILGYLSILKERTDLTDEEYISYAQSVLNYHCSVRGVPFHKIGKLEPISSKPIINNYTPFYKYTSNAIFDQYIKKGIWQLGTIQQYRTIENIKQRDEFEGHSFLNLNINNHIVSTICSSGFNYLIFCGTRKANSDIHKQQFGEKEIYFPNIKSFAESVRKTINAKRYFIQNVEYNTLKLYINKTPIANPEIDINNILTPAYFDVINEHLIYPGLFVKPESFKDENEVRIVFEMPQDYYKPNRFENKDLLNYIKY